MKKHSIWWVVELLSMGFLISLSVNMVIIFFLAYLNEAKVVYVGINWFGEARYERVLFPTFLAIGIVTCIRRLLKHI